MTYQLGIYSYNQTFYTGTDIQPDVLHIFIKPGKENKSFLEHNAAPLANWMGFVPVVSMFSGAARVVNAVKIIFKHLSNLKTISEKDTNRSELWNSFKNIFRGIVEIIPFTGITLILFDSIRNAIHIDKIKNELKDKENIAGIAVDGKVIFTIDLGRVDHIIKNPPPDSKPNEYRLAVFRNLCLTFLEKAEKEKNLKIGMSELFPKLANLS